MRVVAIFRYSASSFSTRAFGPPNRELSMCKAFSDFMDFLLVFIINAGEGNVCWCWLLEHWDS